MAYCPWVYNSLSSKLTCVAAFDAFLFNSSYFNVNKRSFLLCQNKAQIRGCGASHAKEIKTCKVVSVGNFIWVLQNTTSRLTSIYLLWLNSLLNIKDDSNQDPILAVRVGGLNQPFLLW